MTGRAGDVTAAAIAHAAAHLLAQSKQPIVAAVAQATGIAGSTAGADQMPAVRAAARPEPR
jgi:hypothetical protein